MCIEFVLLQVHCQFPRRKRFFNIFFEASENILCPVEILVVLAVLDIV